MKTILQVVQNLLKPYIDAKDDEINSQVQTLTNNDDAMLNVLGAKNLLPNNATTQLSHGIQYQVDSTGKITASGATDGANSWLTIAEFSLAKGKYILSGCPSGGSTSGYALAVNFNGASAQNYDLGNGYEFELSETTTLLVRIRIADPTTLTTNKDFYPMIRPASVEDDTYVPYAMTNRELTIASIRSGFLGEGTGLVETSFPFTAPKDMLVRVTLTSSDTTNMDVAIDGWGVLGMGGVANMMIMETVPLKKGQTIQDRTSTHGTAKLFIPNN